MAKHCVTAVLLLVGIPLSMYALYSFAMLAGIQTGHARQSSRGPADNSGGVEFTSWRTALDYVNKELWDFNVLGRRRGGRHGGVREPVVVASRSSGVERRSSSSWEAHFVPRSDIDSADVALRRKKSADATSSTQRYYNRTKPRGVISVGSWGGSGGQPFYMGDPRTPRLRSITLYHSGAIHSLSCEYTLAGDDYAGQAPRVAGPWGLSDSFGSRGVRSKIYLRSGEHITAVEGTTGRFANVPSVVITSLTFRTSAGRTYGPYGRAAAWSHHFSVPAAPEGACIVGFWGRSGWLLDAIGVYMKPSCSSSSSSSSDTTAYNRYYASRRQEAVVASRSRGGERSSSLKEPHFFVPLSDIDSANVALRRKSRAYATLSTQRYYDNHTSPRGVVSVGSWGGSGGQPFYMDDARTPRLRSIIVYHSGAIHSLSCVYTLAGDNYAGRAPRVAGPWGLSDSFGSRGVRSKIYLRPGEHITVVEGTMGHFANVPSVVITSLTFHTSAGRMYGPYGRVASGSHQFSVPAADGACIVGFWGRSGSLLDAIGVYMKPSCLSSSASSDMAAYNNRYYASRRLGGPN